MCLTHNSLIKIMYPKRFLFYRYIATKKFYYLDIGERNIKSDKIVCLRV